ncbi:hypothetical protein N7492_002606 [Penicillium capsulatum]|uniref:Uncharacterized protein n=1 Tax=Penicillium capsulatum TaxID=69766 RepID=A0A9W9LVC7_9EURO|nr:hypothetical protein N7492_002606 [Penicillium capsulatum]KAJ6122792.1 hypothetical protein N7512_005257 [Penicillium capsulatum]
MSPDSRFLSYKPPDARQPFVTITSNPLTPVVLLYLTARTSNTTMKRVWWTILLALTLQVWGDTFHGQTIFQVGQIRKQGSISTGKWDLSMTNLKKLKKNVDPTTIDLVSCGIFKQTPRTKMNTKDSCWLAFQCREGVRYCRVVVRSSLKLSYCGTAPFQDTDGFKECKDDGRPEDGPGEQNWSVTVTVHPAKEGVVSLRKPPRKSKVIMKIPESPPEPPEPLTLPCAALPGRKRERKDSLVDSCSISFPCLESDGNPMSRICRVTVYSGTSWLVQSCGKDMLLGVNQCDEHFQPWTRLPECDFDPKDFEDPVRSPGQGQLELSPGEDDSLRDMGTTDVVFPNPSPLKPPSDAKCMMHLSNGYEYTGVYVQGLDRVQDSKIHPITVAGDFWRLPCENMPFATLHSGNAHSCLIIADCLKSFNHDQHQVWSYGCRLTGDHNGLALDQCSVEPREDHLPYCDLRSLGLSTHSLS